MFGLSCLQTYRHAINVAISSPFSEIITPATVVFYSPVYQHQDDGDGESVAVDASVNIAGNQW